MSTLLQDYTSGDSDTEGGSDAFGLSEAKSGKALAPTPVAVTKIESSAPDVLMEVCFMVLIHQR